MGEINNNLSNHNIPPSRFGLRISGSGEIVEVHGGHIVRSTNRKDRHSKVCTAKGPRDRRVRLAAHTAIQFYDVQDRLGFDRPSKAVDWLINKAKDAIDELEKMPKWDPVAGSDMVEEITPVADNFSQNSIFFPPSMDSDAIANTNKSFFPISAAASSSNLGLSLQSFHYPNLHNTEQILSGTPIGFDGTATWQEQHHHHHQRLAAWNSGSEFFESAPAQQQNQFSQQRGTLQSSNNPPSIRTWMDPEGATFYPASMNGFGFSCGFQIPEKIQGEEECDGYSDKPSSASSDTRH